ncbi:hypothetical protein D8674_008956 [Pyrus ussuriensis x Pyrus communis]|uniref:Bromo domain-containing protein n=1 Tax=Pyrus ussuriensis x Pyrus communis TaxID=2448454 RepID=A0A5N5HX65_9ROSA|nr:hypothetical protein D8674_008956 [Pyrus ussuriensis x Pyrus communis]
MIFLMDNKPPNFPQKQTPTWGTWEELLLAGAVHRFGTQSWNSVATELRKRSSNLHLLTPHACKRKFHDLHRRFNHSDNMSAASDDDKSPIPWLDQLRQRRLDELRRELQRYDRSIVCLQSKVKRLKEVREHSLWETEKPVEKSDLEKTGEEEIKPDDVLPEKKDISGDLLVHDGQSFDESNTTDRKPEEPGTGYAGTGNGSDPNKPVEPAGKEIGSAEKSSNPAVEDSCNGSSDSVAKEPAGMESEKGNSGELRESMAESKGGEEGTKESRQSSSEVKSSVRLSRKAGNDPEPVGPGEPSEPEQEDRSPATKRVPVESQPLVDFLAILRCHKFASLFECRLHSQDNPIYTKMIRQHLDFEMVQTRLEGGWYSHCSRMLFFRDLLIIYNNAIVFFGKMSPEYKAACELRSLVSKEMARLAPKQDAPSEEEILTQPAPPLNPDPETSDSFLAKSKLSLPLNACCKRSSIAARASTSSLGPDTRKKQATCDVKPAVNWKQKEESSDEIEKFRVTKKRRKEGLGSSTRNNTSKNVRTRSYTNNNRSSDANENSESKAETEKKRVVSSNENSGTKTETEKKRNNNASGKKRSAANFLMKSSSSKTGSLLETSKNPENNSKGRRAEQRKNGNGKGNTQNDQGSRRSSGGRQATKEQERPSKRSAGRPSKRAAAAAPTTAGPTKRARGRGS